MTWWQRLTRRKQMEAQLEKEMRFHLDEHTNELIAQGGLYAELYHTQFAARRAPIEVSEEIESSLADSWQPRDNGSWSTRTRPA